MTIKRKLRNRTIYKIVVIILFLLVIYFSYHGYLNYFYNKNELSFLSNIGQYLSGTVGTIISLIVAFAALMAFREQRRQIALFERANLKQSIENTFFRLLEYHERIVNTMDITQTTINKNDLHVYQGRNAFQTMYEVFSEKYTLKLMGSFIMNDITEPFDENKKEKIIRSINEAYLQFDMEYQPYLGYYFRNLYYIIKLIDENDLLTFSEKHYYIRMLRAHLSSYELLLLFYSSLSDRGTHRVKPLIEKYQLLKHIYFIKDKLLDRHNTDHLKLYNVNAYK